MNFIPSIPLQVRGRTAKKIPKQSDFADCGMTIRVWALLTCHATNELRHLPYCSLLTGDETEGESCKLSIETFKNNEIGGYMAFYLLLTI